MQSTRIRSLFSLVTRSRQLRNGADGTSQLATHKISHAKGSTPSSRFNRSFTTEPPTYFSRSVQSNPPRRPSSSMRKSFSSQSNWPSPTRRPTIAQQRMTKTRDGYTHFGKGPGNGSTQPSTNRHYILGISAGALAIYLYTNLDYAPFTGRARILGISRSQEMLLGKQAYDELLRSFDGRILPPNHRVSLRVRKIVSKIAGTVLRIDPSLSEGFEWEVVVAAEDEPNAMCVPGGRILITTGLLRILPTDDDIAIVLAHEIAHALNRHGAESMHLQRMLMPIIFIANQFFDMRWVPSLILTLFLSLPYARTLEYEADEVGLQLCAEACYDPRVAPDVFRRLAALQERHTGTVMADRIAPFLSTHPQSKERASRLNDAVPQQMERYNDKCVVGSSFPQFVKDYPGFDYPDHSFQ